MKAEPKKLGLFNYISYGVGDIFGGGSYLIIGTLFLFFLTDTVGLSPAKAGLVIFAGKFWDAISDPLMGFLSDRTKTRFGRRRVFFLAGVLPVFISFMLLWLPSDFIASELRFVWHLFTYVFFCTVLTFVMVPYIALNAEMTEDYKIRNKLAGSRITFSGVSILICGVVPMLIVESKDVASQGYLVMGAIFGAFFALPWLLTFAGTWELPQKTTASVQSLREFFLSFFSVMRNRSFRMQSLMYIFAYSAMDILMVLFVYFLTYYVLRGEQFSLLMGSLMLVYIATIPFYVKISNVIGQGKAYIIGMCIGALATVVLFFTFTPNAPIYILVLGASLMGMGLSGGAVVVHAMLPPVIDVDKLMTTDKRSGTYAGMLTLIRKAIQALILFLVSIGLSLIGYSADAVITADTAAGLRYMIVFGPLLVFIMGIYTGFKYKITPKVHQCLLEEIERLESGGSKSDVDSVTARICKEVSGMAYESLFDPKNR